MCVDYPVFVTIWGRRFQHVSSYSAHVFHVKKGQTLILIFINAFLGNCQSLIDNFFKTVFHNPLFSCQNYKFNKTLKMLIGLTHLLRFPL